MARLAREEEERKKREEEEERIRLERGLEPEHTANAGIYVEENCFPLPLFTKVGIMMMFYVNCSSFSFSQVLQWFIWYLYLPENSFQIYIIGVWWMLNWAIIGYKIVLDQVFALHVSGMLYAMTLFLQNKWKRLRKRKRSHGNHTFQRSQVQFSVDFMLMTKESSGSQWFVELLKFTYRYFFLDYCESN